MMQRTSFFASVRVGLALLLCLVFAGLFAAGAPAKNPAVRLAPDLPTEVAVAIEQRLGRDGLREGEFRAYRPSVASPGELFVLRQEGSVAILLRHAPPATRILVSAYTTPLSAEEARATYGETHQVRQSALSGPSGTVEYAGLYPRTTTILGDTRADEAGQLFAVGSLPAGVYAVALDLGGGAPGAIEHPVGAGVELTFVTGEAAAALAAQRRGAAPDIAVDKAGIEIDCPSLPTNVTRGGTASATAAPLGPVDGHDHADHADHDHAAGGAGAPREIAGLVALADVATFRGATTGQPFDVRVEAALLADLYDHHEPTILRGVPVVGGGTADFLLEPFEVFTPDAKIVGFDGTTETPAPRPNVRLFHGGQLGNAARDIILSVTEGRELRVFVREQGREVLSITPDAAAAGRAAGTPTHTAALGMTAAAGTFCTAEEFAENFEALNGFAEPDPAEMLRRLETGRDACFGDRLETEILVDVNQGLFTGVFGSSEQTATNYVANLFGFASAIYQRDVNNYLSIDQLVIWTAPDPFGGSNSGAQLTNYRNYNRDNRPGVSRDLAHLLANEVNFGGIAYVGALCTTNTGYGVSNIFGNQNISATIYTWDVSVVAHEIGHNFNSPHTHCYNPPIDCCYNEQCACGPAVAQVGTIMSYCHLNGSVALNFHPRVIDVMTAYQASRSCIQDYEGVPERRFVISNAGDAPLTIESIELDTPTPWITLCPTFPVTIEAGQSLNLHVEIDCPDVPPGETVRTLIVTSDDPDENPLPGGLTITVRKPFRYPLATAVEPAGAGSVTLSPGRGPDGQFEEGTVVTVRGIPALGWAFSGWTGDASGTVQATTVTMDAARSVTANFEPARYTLDVTADPAAGGTIEVTPEPGPGGDYLAGSELVLEAIPNPGYTFDTWLPLATDNPTTITLTKNTTMVAKFKAGYRLTVNQQYADAGIIRITPDEADDIYDPGTLVRVRAQPANGYVFAGWTGDRTSSAIQIDFNINADTTLLANYTPPKYAVAVAANPPEGGTVTLDPAPDAQGRYDRNTVVTVTAHPESGYGFLGWSGDTTETASSFQVTVTAASTFTAEFAPLFNPLTVTVEPPGAGTVDANPGPDQVNLYSLGIEVTLTASPLGDYTFLQWEGDAAGTDATTAVTMNGARNITARFRPPQFALSAGAIPLDGGTIVASPGPNPDNGLYDKDTEVQLTAQPALGFVFRQWSGDASGTALTTTVTVSGSLTVTAEFETQSSILVR